MSPTFGSRAPKGKASRRQTKARASARAQSKIKQYEKLFNAELSGAELTGMIDDAFSGLDIPDSIKGEVKEKLKKRKGKGKRAPPPKEKAD
jgi:hypothetical protein